MMEESTLQIFKSNTIMLMRNVRVKSLDVSLAKAMTNFKRDPAKSFLCQHKRVFSLVSILLNDNFNDILASLSDC